MTPPRGPGVLPEPCPLGPVPAPAPATGLASFTACMSGARLLWGAPRCPSALISGRFSSSAPVRSSSARPCEFDYSGTQAIKALREEGVEVVLLNSNPATIMTDPEFAHRTYIEPITVEVAEQDHRRRAARLPPAHHGRSDGPQPRQGTRRAGHPREVRRAPHRRLARGHQQGRGPPALQGRHAEDRRGPAQERLRPLHGGGPRRSSTGSASRHHPPLLHPGRHRRRHRLQPRGVRGHRRAGLKASPTSTILDRGERARLEGVRTRGHPRLGRQRHHRLLHRELGPHGRPHR